MPGAAGCAMLIASKGDLTFQTTFSRTLDSNVSLGTGNFVRVVIGAAALSVSGSNVKVTFEAQSAGSLVIDNAWIGPKAGSGNAWDFAAGQQKRLKFSGNNGVTISSGTQGVSDILAYSLNEAVDQVVHFQVSTTGTLRRLDVSANTNVYFKAGTDDGTDAPSGMTNYSGNPDLWVVAKIEVA